MKKSFIGTWVKDGKVIKVNLFMLIFTEDDNHIVYCPALNLTGYGKTEAHAKESFEVVLDEYLKYTTNKNTLVDDLRKHGWTIKKNLRKPAIPPDFSELLMRDAEVKNVFDNYPFKKEYKQVEIPAFA
jgi:hypothetical protein